MFTVSFITHIHSLHSVLLYSLIFILLCSLFFMLCWIHMHTRLHTHTGTPIIGSVLRKSLNSWASSPGPKHVCLHANFSVCSPGCPQAPCCSSFILPGGGLHFCATIRNPQAVSDPKTPEKGEPRRGTPNAPLSDLKSDTVFILGSSAQ